MILPACFSGIHNSERFFPYTESEFRWFDAPSTKEPTLNCSQIDIPHNCPIKAILSTREVMADVLTKKQRSYCMSQIRGKNTKPEVILRKALWSMGYRYRIKNKLPGKPDLVYPSLKVAIFVDGCFWHKCPKHYQPPKTRPLFWENKINGNVERDKMNDALLSSQGWLAIRIWEHEIKESVHDCTQRISKLLTNRKDYI